MDFESPPSEQFYLSSPAPLLFARVYLYWAIKIESLLQVENIASLELANFEIELMVTSKEMMGEATDYQVQRCG